MTAAGMVVGHGWCSATAAGRCGRPKARPFCGRPAGAGEGGAGAQKRDPTICPANPAAGGCVRRGCGEPSRGGRGALAGIHYRTMSLFRTRPETEAQPSALEIGSTCGALRADRIHRIHHERCPSHPPVVPVPSPGGARHVPWR